MPTQSIIGDWLVQGTTPTGTAYTNKISVKADGTIEVDFGNDGTINVVTTYTLDNVNDRISLLDTDENSPCYNIVGLYEFRIKGNTNTVRVVNDPCVTRSQGNEDLFLTRIE